MRTFHIDRLLEFFSRISLPVALLWVGLAALSIALLVLSRTQWGQAQPIRKCLLLSLLAHLLLAGYATTVQIVGQHPFQRPEPVVRVLIADAELSPEQAALPSEAREMPWDSYADESSLQPAKVDIARADSVTIRLPQRRARTDRYGLSKTTILDRPPLTEPVQAEPSPLSSHASPRVPQKSRPPEAIEAPLAKRRDPARPVIREPAAIGRPSRNATASTKVPRTRRVGQPASLLRRQVPLPRLSDVSHTPEPQQALAGKTDLSTPPSQGRLADLPDLRPSHLDTTPPQVPADRSEKLASPGIDHIRLPSPSLSPSSDPKVGFTLAGSGSPEIGPPLVRINRRGHAEHQVPTIYSLRMAPDRSNLALRNGASLKTEGAVQAALKWLADNQQPDGRWNAKAHGAGKEWLVAGRDRMGAGTEADTAVTGLALLAFLACGHTHQHGQHRTNVLGAVEFLLDTQQADGSLGGLATNYAYMYCHAIATFALSEAFGMTGDQRLADPVRRAVGYTLSVQNPSTGGWRYNPGDAGDTSLLGWHVMGLKSAELAGIPIPAQTRQGAFRFLDSASTGSHQGLTAYRPTELASRPMTAEALVCRLFLGMGPREPRAREAGNYLLGELPGQGKTNLYYWYYATLGMYQLQGEYWRRWNDALQRTLLASQERYGRMAGSWSPDTVWGGYGGRVYSTALGALCLEVYYRFLPLNIQAASVDQLQR